MSRAYDYDFGGWATRNNLRCSDGRTIRKDAFKDNDGQTVPLVWNHSHNDPMNVLGHALLENREDGVYAYCTFNDTAAGKNAKHLVEHGDVTSLSIYANKLKQRGTDVIHGAIREVSLVLAGANPGALIDFVLEHDGMESDDSAVIYSGLDFDEVLSHTVTNSMNPPEEIEAEAEEEPRPSKPRSNKRKAKTMPEPEEVPEEDLSHADEDDYYDEGDSNMDENAMMDMFDTFDDDQKDFIYELVGRAVEDTRYEMSHADDEGEDFEDEDDEEETVGDVLDTLTDKQRTVVYALIGQAIEDAKGGSAKHSDYDDLYLMHAEEGEETVADVFETLTPKQKKVVYALIGQVLEDADNDEEDDGDEEDEGEEPVMKHNVFETDEMYGDDYLSHSEIDAIFSDAQRNGSLKAAAQEAALAHGIDNIDYLFPDARNVTDTPEFITEPDEWVAKVMNGTRHTPFARIKTLYADITEADARAKGYIKGNRKVEEVFNLLKRVTTPTTIYKKQKLDRDDIVDITGFDVVAWLKTEMRGKLDEDIARAVLIGDGRNAASEEKINEINVRPIWTDDELFTIKKAVSLAANATDDAKAKAFIRAARKARKNYRGSGTPTLFTTEDVLTDCLLMEDNVGRVIYDTVEKLATALRVKEIVTVPPMEGAMREEDGKTYSLLGLIVNLADYNVGADKGGAVNMFDDFDIDYNQQKYLIETRCSGALVKPFSAIALELTYSAILDVEPEDPTQVILGKAVSALQEDVMVHDKFIKGTLHYVTGYTQFSETEAEQSGNFIALKFEVSDGSTTTVQLTGQEAKTLDNNKNCVLRITDKNKQKLKVVTTLGDETITKTFSLAGLTLETV